MSRSDRAPRAFLGSLLGALLLLQGVAVPLLERSDGGAKLVLESEHSAATCVHVHDHTICTQVGANHTLSSATVQHRLPVVAVDEIAPGGVPRLHSAPIGSAHRPRGPPTA